MTWGNPPAFVPTKPKKGKVITPEMLAGDSEDSQQMALFAWAALSVGKYPQLKWLYAVPNGGSRHIAEATKMVATGLRKGVPDIALPIPIQRRDYHSFHEAFKYGYHGCYIELKIKKRRKEENGGCSSEQVSWLEQLQSMGYFVAVCYGWEDARDTLIAYLEGKL